MAQQLNAALASNPRCQRLPLRLGKKRPGNQAHWGRIGQQGAGFEHTAIQRVANDAAARRHQNVSGALCLCDIHTLRHHIAAVVNAGAHRPGGVETVFQARECRIGVHDHRVEVAVGEPARAVVVVALVGPGVDQDVAQAADHLRMRSPRAAALLAHLANHRQDLAGKLLAPEREQFHQQHGRAMLCDGSLDQRAALHLGRRDIRARVVAAHQRVAIVHAQRRQVDQFDARRNRDAGWQAPTIEEHDLKVLAQRSGQRKRTGQVADAQRMLAVEHQRRPTG